MFILSLLGLVKIGLGPGTILGCQRTITRIMRSKASTYIHGFTNKNDEVFVGWVHTNPNDVYSMKSCCFSNNPVKDRLHQIAVEVSGTLTFFYIIWSFVSSCSLNLLSPQVEEEEEEEEMDFDLFGWACHILRHVFDTRDGARWKPKTEKEIWTAGAADSQVHTWKMVVSESVVQMVLLIFFWICLVTSISQLQKVFRNH